MEIEKLLIYDLQHFFNHILTELESDNVRLQNILHTTNHALKKIDQYNDIESKDNEIWTWKCPTCETYFKQDELFPLMKIINEKIRYLNNPLASDYNITDRDRLISIYNSLRHMQLKFRQKSKMMESQIIQEIPCECFCHKNIYENASAYEITCNCIEKDRCIVKGDNNAIS